MTIESFKAFSLGFGTNSSLVSTHAALSELKKGKIHILSETLSRDQLFNSAVILAKATLKKTGQDQANKLLHSSFAKWAITLAPVTLGYLKYQTQTNYPLLTKSLSHLENCMEKSAYAISIVSSIALVRFGHLLAGYSGLSVLLFDQIVSNNFARTHIPLIEKVDAVFKTYISPIVSFAVAVVSGSYIPVAYALFGLICMIYRAFTRDDIQVQETPINNTENFLSNPLTLEKWIQFNKQDSTRLEINQKRNHPLFLPATTENSNSELSILAFLEKLPINLQKKLIERVKTIPGSNTIETFDQAIKVSKEHLEALVSFTKQQSNPIWKTLLQQLCIALQNSNNNSEQLYPSVIEYLFGSGGQCQVAQQRNILSGFSSLNKSLNKTEIDLELRFNLALESLSSDTFRLFLHKMIAVLYSEKNENICQKEANRSPLFLSLFLKGYSLLSKGMRAILDVTDMHTYQRLEKLYGPLFGIKPIAKDLVAEQEQAEIESNPIHHFILMSLIKNKKSILNTSIPTYFKTQLQKITPWLNNQIVIDSYFSSNDFGLWFSQWIEKQSLPDDMTEALQNELFDNFTIKNYPIYNPDGSITPAALIAFLYGMGVLTDSSKENPLSISVKEMKQTVHRNPENMPPDLLRGLKELDIDPNIVFV